MRKITYIFLAGLTISILTATGTSLVFAETVAGFSEKITSLGRAPEGYKIIKASIKFSPDLRHVTYAAYKEITSNIVRLDNQTSPVYYAVSKGFPIFSPNNRNAYVAYKSKDGDAVVVVDWKPDPGFGTVDNFKFSPDGSRYVYRVDKNGRQCVVIDGKPDKWYTGIPVNNNFVFSPDSRHVAYVAFSDNACVLVLDGKEQNPKFEFIQDVTFSFDSKSIAYKGRIEKKGTSETWCMVNNGIKQNPYDDISWLFHSPDSNHLAYSALKNKKMVLVVDGKEKEAHDQYGLPVFSPDSKRLAYSYLDGKNFHLVVGENKGPAFPQIYRFYFSYDSSRYAYMAGEENNWKCIVDGLAGLQYHLIEGFKFSPDSTHYAYGAVTKDGDGIVVIDGKPQETYLTVGEPYFSPDSKHTVYRGRSKQNKKWITVLNGKKHGESYKYIHKYHFSPTSKHLAFIAQESAKKSIMVVDGVKQCSDENFDVLDDPYFSPNGNHVAYVAATKTKEFSLVVNGHVLPNKYGGLFKGTPITFDAPDRFHIIGMRDPGPEFLLIDVKIPESVKLKTEFPKP